MKRRWNAPRKASHTLARCMILAASVETNKAIEKRARKRPKTLKSSKTGSSRISFSPFLWSRFTLPAFLLLASSRIKKNR